MKKFKLFIILLFVIILINTSLNFFHDQNVIDTNEFNLYTKKIDKQMHGLKIVHFSDTHFDNKNTQRKIHQLVSEINTTKPDLIVFTGDLVKNNLSADNQSIIVNELNQITYTTAKVAVFGEKDQSISTQILSAANFTILQNELLPLYFYNNQPIYIIGYKNKPTLNKLDLTITKNKLIIVLNHNPEYTDNIVSIKPDFIFSGHTHNQEINIPFVALNDDLDSKYSNGKYIIDSTELYVTNGIGNVVYPFRFNSKPAINLYRLLKKN